MVSELRVKETVSMGVETSPNGHMVFFNASYQLTARIRHAPAGHGYAFI